MSFGPCCGQHHSSETRSSGVASDTGSRVAASSFVHEKGLRCPAGIREFQASTCEIFRTGRPRRRSCAMVESRASILQLFSSTVCALAVDQHMRALRALFVVVLVSASAAADEIDRLVEARLKRDNVPGTSIAVVRNGKVLKARGYGFADVENKVP